MTWKEPAQDPPPKKAGGPERSRPAPASFYAVITLDGNRPTRPAAASLSDPPSRRYLALPKNKISSVSRIAPLSGSVAVATQI